MLKTAAQAIRRLFISITRFCFLLVYPRCTVPILVYHRFDYGKGALSLTPENFERQMRYLKDKRYKIISFEELVDGIKAGRKFARRTIVITIDDGDKSVYTCGYPILKKYGFPVIVFLTTDHIGTNADFLNWDQAREMSGNNISFGGHTKSHPSLLLVDNKVMWDEIVGCKDSIEKHLGLPADYFSYPFGEYIEEAKAFVRKAGYKGACMASRKLNILNRMDVYGLNRVPVLNTDPFFSFRNLYAPFRFRAKLLGYFNAFVRRKGCC